MGKIQFMINFEVKLKRKVKKFLDLYQNEIGYDFQELKIERYWKIEGQFQASFFVETASTEKENKVYDALIFANKLESSGGRLWTVNGPHFNDKLIFELYLDNSSDDQPLKWAHIELNDE